MWAEPRTPTTTPRERENRCEPMDPIIFLTTLFTSTSFGLPLVALVVGGLAWWFFMPKVSPPTMVPRPVWRDPSPDPVSLLYWSIASGSRTSVIQYIYHRWSEAVYRRFKHYPYQIPWRRGKASKLGIPGNRELISLDKDLLELYYLAMRIDGRSPGDMTGELIWGRRIRSYEARLGKAMSKMALRVPEVWGE